MKKNQIIRNHATGETLTMLVSDEENAGAYQLYEVGLPPHRPSPPLHYHEDFIETFKGWSVQACRKRVSQINCTYRLQPTIGADQFAGGL